MGAELLRRIEQMRAEQDGDAVLRREPQQKIADLLPPMWVETGEGLVQ